MLTYIAARYLVWGEGLLFDEMGNINPRVIGLAFAAEIIATHNNEIMMIQEPSKN